MASMPRAIVDLDQVTESVNLLVYGDTGTGKTELVGRLPGKVLIISSENGTRVIRRAIERAGGSWAKEKKRFKVWRIHSWADLEAAYLWCRDNQSAFDWIAIDSATSVQQRAMRAAMEKAVHNNPEKRDIDLPDRGEHQKMQNATKRMITDFNELDTNVFWLAQSMHREDKDGNEIVLPFIMGKDYEVSAFACAQMQAFGYYMKRGSKKVKGRVDRVMLWDSVTDNGSDVTYWAKDRYDILPKTCVMAQGDEQLVDFADQINAILKDDGAISRAARAVDTRDEPEDEPDEPTQDEPAEPDEDGEEDDDIAGMETPEAFREYLEGLTAAALKAYVVNDLGMDTSSLKGLNKAGVIDAAVAYNFQESEGSDEADEDDDLDPDAAEDLEDESADEPEGDEPEDVMNREERKADLMGSTTAQIKEAILANGMKVADVKGLNKSQVVEAILDVEFEPESEEDEDDDLDLDEMMDDDEPEPGPEPAPKATTRKTAAKKATATKRFRATTEED